MNPSTQQFSPFLFLPSKTHMRRAADGRVHDIGLGQSRRLVEHAQLLVEQREQLRVLDHQANVGGRDRADQHVVGAEHADGGDFLGLEKGGLVGESTFV